MSSKTTKYLFISNLILAVALLHFCFPLAGRYAHRQATLVSTLNELKDPHVELVQGLAHTDIIVSSRVVLFVSGCLFLNAAISLFALRRARKRDGTRDGSGQQGM